MPTLAIEVELPEAEYRAALALPESERQRRIVNAFAIAKNETDDSEDYHRDTNEADLKAIGQGLQALAEGRTTPGDVVFARLKEQARNGLPAK